jgi:hypothetical protein
MLYACLYKCIQCVGIPSCGDDVINRTIIRVVATIILVSGVACRASSLLYYFRAYFHTVRVWAEVVFCRYITSLLGSTY